MWLAAAAIWHCSRDRALHGPVAFPPLLPKVAAAAESLDFGVFFIFCILLMFLVLKVRAKINSNRVA
jgi:hypothetical protein